MAGRGSWRPTQGPTPLIRPGEAEAGWRVRGSTGARGKLKEARGWGGLPWKDGADRQNTRIVPLSSCSWLCNRRHSISSAWRRSSHSASKASQTAAFWHRDATSAWLSDREAAEACRLLSCSSSREASPLYSSCDLSCSFWSPCTKPSFTPSHFSSSRTQALRFPSSRWPAQPGPAPGQIQRQLPVPCTLPPGPRPVAGPP